MSRPGLLTAGYIVVVFLFAVLANAWTGHEPGWYDALRRPWFQPPDWVFGVMWPLNFFALGVVGVVLTERAPERSALVFPLVVASVAAALGWAYLFYVPHALVAAAYALGVAALLTWVSVGLIASAVWWLGLALIPYAAWLSVATALSFGYARLN